MPELPEVETMRRGVVCIVGSRVVLAARPPCDKRPMKIGPDWPQFRRRVEGRLVRDVGRVGKRVVLLLDDETRVILEPRMTGLVLLAQPPTIEHLRLRLTLADGPAEELLFWDRRGLGSVRALTADEFSAELGPHRIGPDALSITPALLAERLGSSRREIKPALLDQKAVAGVGNLYASELLHRAKIHPQRRCDGLRPSEWKTLHAELLAVLLDAIEHEGSTLSDGTYRNALNQDGGYQNLHRVYDKADQLCPTCGRSPIVRIVQTQRSTFFCPRCQRLPK